MNINNGGRQLRTTMTSLEVIEKLRELDGARVTELAEVLDLSPSTVHAHLSTLAGANYVVKSGDIYHLGLQFLELADYVRNRRNAYRTAESYTDRLARETECRAVFAVEENGRGVYMYTYSGEHAVWKYSTVGKRFYLHQTAVGKAILSRLPEERVIAIIEEWGLPTGTANTITDRSDLLEELKVIRDRGVSFNNEEQLEGVKAVGVPVDGSDGRVAGAFSVASPANRMTEDRFEEEIPKILLGVANEFELENSMS
ncbi:IclR family transcriptional regulator [Halogeometricum luteum]|uniref:IclR family transcriptional regulator n=1 Tax=Halogeometricum luteum TaxID=2950537 RepID=A0ABU2G2C7_9EURY|nr:IclR family transcriptional regulator [Halogeometricum sp. S3BR5-2]MDS0294941.1 IclR family transcriptional regulator [Halogeometricum sp. S3BR5-2]